ncbi:hypothetical protein D3C87_2046910 [compost metagenome]
MAVIFIEAQLRIGSGSAEVPGMILPFVMTVTADAWQMTIPVPNEIVKCLLSLADEIV